VVPAVVIKIIQVAGAVYTTYTLAKAAIDGGASSPDTEKDYVDPVGNQTTRGVVWKPGGSVGMLDLRWSIATQTIPQGPPRGQFLTEFAVVLHREEAQTAGATLPVSVELEPSWYDKSIADFVSLPAGTFYVDLPVGSHVAQGFLVVDGNQAFFGDGSQTFYLRAKIVAPTGQPKWSARPLPNGPLLQREQYTENGLAIDFDYVHLFWE
jgi:hypothetical protein